MGPTLNPVKSRRNGSILAISASVMASRRIRFRLVELLAALVLSIGSPARLRGAESKKPADPLQDWAVQEGYSLQIVARGFSFPTAIAVVPQPGSDPGAPRMFVTELRGTVKAVANDGSVTEFARRDTFKPAIEWPDSAGEGGMAGICLAPEPGYLFVTYTYRDQYGILRNAISRYTAKPSTFEGSAGDPRHYLELFAEDSSAFSHQIGACVVSGDSLYVAVADGGDPGASRNLDKTLGKMLRLTLDGRPHPANPFASAGGRAAAVYAYGLRNPFGFQVVGGRVFAAENGVKIDRFLEIRRGTDYQWDGTDSSIAANASMVFTPTICPVHVAYEAKDQGPLQPLPNGRFLIAASEEEEGEQGSGVVSLEYDLERNMVIGSPKYVVRLQRHSPGQGVVGLALSPEGLFMAPIMPVGPSGVVMMTRYDPEHAHTKVIGRASGPVALIQKFQCLKCHSLGGVGGSQGPALDKNSLSTRTQSRVLDPGYPQLLARIDAIPDQTVQASSAARKEVLSTPREDDRVRVWVVNRLLHPKFDMPNAQMPQMEMTREQAESIARYLLREPQQRHWLRQYLTRRFLGSVAIGLVGGLGLAGVVAIWVTRRSRRNRRAAPLSG
jgi:glucose/arabinose dehydrogenase